MLHRRNGARFPSDMTPKSSTLVSSDQRITFLMVWESFRYPLANSKWAVLCLLLRGFRLATLPSRPDWWSAAEMVVLLEGYPLSTEELQSSVREGPRPFSPDCSFWPGDQLYESLSGSKILPFNGGHCVLGDLQCCRHGTFPQICVPTQSYLRALRTIPLTSLFLL